MIAFCKSLLADRIGSDTSRFAGNMVFFSGKRMFMVAEESRLACATGAAILALSSIPVDLRAQWN